MNVPFAAKPRQFSLSRLIWGAIVFIGIIDALWMKTAHIGMDISKALIFFPVLAGCFGISFFYGRIRRDDSLNLLAQITNQMLCAAAVLGVLSYLSAQMNLPLVDSKLADLDSFMGFHWQAYIAWVNSIPWLALALRESYISSGPQMLVLLVLLFLCNQSAQAQRFVMGFIVCGFITIIFSAFYPAMGGYGFYHIDITQFPNLSPIGAQLHEKALSALRAEPLTTIAFPLSGVVMFPSFHSALSILLIYMSLPIRRMPAIIVPLNILVLMSTPTDGGHYFIDAIAGIIIALVVIRLTEYLLPRHPSGN